MRAQGELLPWEGDTLVKVEQREASEATKMVMLVAAVHVESSAEGSVGAPE